MKLATICLLSALTLSQAFAAREETRNCSNAEVDGYVDETLESQDESGKITLNIQGARARQIYQALKDKALEGEIPGSFQKVNATTDCIKQEMEHLKCAVYLCVVKK